jgi:hypothetical protein
MKIKTKVLTTFLKKFRMGGLQQIEECVMRFEKEGLKINANSNSKQARSMAWLKTSAFTEYEVFGNIGVNDLSNIVRVLERIGDVVQVKKEGNLLTIIGDKKKVDIELVSENFLNTDIGEPVLEFTETFNIKAEQLNDIFKDVQLNKDSLITIETKDKKTAFSNTGKYKFITELETPTCVGGCKTTFGQPLIDAVANFDGQLEVSINNDYPCKIIEKTEQSVVTVIVAPRVVEAE